MKKTFTIFLFAFVFSLPAAAQDMESGPYASARFIAGDENVDKKTSAAMGLDITLKDGWYTYWRMAGDNGLPPKFNWSGSKNVKHVEIAWPAPSRFTLMDMHSFGYSDHVLLPLTVTAENPAEPVSLDLKLDIVVCHEICIPESLHVSGTGQTVLDAKALETVRAKLPAKENSDDLGITAAVLGKDVLVVSAYAKGGFHKDADLVIETPSPLLTVPPQILIDEKDPDRAVLKLIAPAGMDLTKQLFGKTATIVLIHGGKSLEKEFTF